MSSKKSLVDLYKEEVSGEVVVLHIKKEDYNAYLKKISSLFLKAQKDEKIFPSEISATMDLLFKYRKTASINLSFELAYQAHEYFKDAADYQILAKEVEINLYEMIFRSIVHLTTTRELEDIKKADCIRVLYSGMKDYLKTYEPFIKKQKLTHYKLTIIATYITFVLGIKFNGELSEEQLEGRKPTKDQLNIAGKLATKQLKGK